MLDTSYLKQHQMTNYSNTRQDLFQSPRIVPRTEPTHLLVTYMHVREVSAIKDANKKHFRRKLHAEFGNTFHIFPDSKGKLLVFLENLSK